MGRGVEKTDAGLIRGIGVLQGTAINMSQMVGAGAFVTIPIILSTMGGPQALFGWIAGMILAMADGLVWAELGAAMPGEGGSYVYLREAFQYRTGKLMPFLFIWSIILATSLTMGTGMVAIAQYLQFFWPNMTGLETQLLAILITIITVLLLFRKIDAIGKITVVLWGGVMLTVLLVFVAAATHFHPSLAFSFPKGVFAPSKFFTGLGAGMLIAIYDYLGYNTTCYMGGEMRDPGRTIPRSVILSVFFVAIIDIGINVGVIGVVPWQEAAKSSNVGALFMEQVWGRPGAVLLTLLIIWCIFAAVYTGLLGASRLPYNAAVDGVFFKSFAKLHNRYKFPHISLLIIGFLTAISCFFSLTELINTLIAVSILVQFIGQIVALSVLRKRQPNLKRPFKQWLYPIPSIIAFAGWVYVFGSSGKQSIELAFGWIALGIVVFLVWARIRKEWPFGHKIIREGYLAPELSSGYVDG